VVQWLSEGFSSRSIPSPKQVLRKFDSQEIQCAVNQNLKKPMDRKDKPEWRYKTWAISRSAEMLREVVPDTWITRVTFVPVPPSKTKDHAEYDDRLLQILQRLAAGRELDVRELVVMTEY
jgi:hypothetical protein